MIEELTVPGDPSLVVRDLGGPPDGRTVVLLHGFGGNALHWTSFAPLLTDRFRVLAPDLRGHGRSADGPWRWDLLVDDLERTVAHLGVARPAVVGHSLGGGIASLWAQRHPDCPGAVNLDGLPTVEARTTDGPDDVADRFVGLAPRVVHARLAELTATFDQQARAMAEPLSAERLDTIREHHRQQGGQAAVDMLDRNVALISPDTLLLRPNAATVRAFRAQLHECDLFEVFATVRAPLLVGAATHTLPEAKPFADLLEAHRRGLDRDLSAAERANPRLRVERIPASHAMVAEQPAALAALIRDFLG